MSPRAAALAAFAAAALAACVHHAHPRGAAAPLPALARLRAATGAVPAATPVLATRGTARLAGLSGTFESLEDLADGRHHSATSLGAIHVADGFDGERPWERSPGGEVVVQDAPEAVARARTEAWLTRRGYLRDDGVRYRDLGARADGAAHFHVVEATPDGGDPVELWIDDAGGRLARTVRRAGPNTIVTTLDDYRPVGALQVAFHARVDPGDPRNVADLVVTAAELRGPLAAAAWARPSGDDGRLTMRGGARSTTVPFELINNHIYVHATVDGKPVRMLVDTGGLALLTPAAAAQLGLEASGKMAAQGAGAKKVDVAMARGHRLSVGDAELADPMFFVLDLGRLPDIEGEDFDGLVGFELFHRLAVRIDYPARTLTLTLPDAFTPPAGAIAVPFDLADRIPIVDGAIDGVPGRFSIDTGARQSLTTTAPFTRAHDLVGRYHPRFETVTGFGVGGEVRSRPVRFAEVHVGKAVVEGVAGDLFTGNAGAMTDRDTAANLGGGVLRRFAVTFDYAHRTMYLQPGPDAAAPDPYDRAGMFLMRDGAALKVVAVTPGGPAEHAGVRAGDRIVAIDGAAPGSRRLGDWRVQLATRPVGTKVTLGIERAGKRTSIAITLAELLP